MSLYTKYRPRDWDSVIGQDAISTILRTSLIQDRVGHAYILTGSRGTGKTTTARILAKGVNCKDLQNGNPCHKCTHCVAFDEGNMLDCIEIDGASNNGVENVRDLIEKARFEPNQGKYKIYIIDEVHMLSTGAFNALLKTLEEPPAHVKFILATTEIDKVPETIRSRSLRFDFKKISEADIVKRLEFVCGEEKITAEKEGLEIIARAARGALRDALTLTEQNTVDAGIRTEYVRSTLSLIEDALIDEIIRVISSSDREAMIHILDTLRSRHAEVRGLFDQILYSLRDLMLESFQGKNKTNSIGFGEYSEIFAIFESAYSKIKIIPDSWLLIEITLLRAVAREENHEMKKKINDENSGMGVRGEGTVQKFSKEKQQKEKFSSDDEKGSQMSGANIGASAPSRSVGNTLGVLPPLDAFDTFGSKSMENTVSEENTEETVSEEKISKEKKTESSTSSFSYIRLLEEVKKIKSTLVLDLKTARFELSGTMLTLIFSKEWHYNRTNTPSMKNIICESLGDLYSGNWTIVCRLDANNTANIVDEVF